VNFLIDTNVVSEWVKPRPDPGVVDWLTHTDEDRIYLSVASLAELRYGVERLPKGRRRVRLDTWLSDELPSRFENRIISVDENVAEVWGFLVASRAGLGRPIGAMDAFIAATANFHAMTLVSRNEADLRDVAAAYLNPWRS